MTAHNMFAEISRAPAAVVLLMILVAAFAALIPSLRAAHVDPMQVLREE